jgi:hypothetical protein
LIQARDGPAPRPVFALARRERCAHPRAVGTGAGADGAGGGVGSQARPAAEDARQLQPAALTGQEAEPRWQACPVRSPPGQPRPQRWWAPAGRGAGRDRHRPPLPLCALPGGAGRGRPEAGGPLRQARSADGRPGGDAGGALRRALPLLRRHHPGAAARGAGAGHAVQPRHRGPGDVPALRPPRQLPAAQPAAARAVRPRHQRGRAGRRIPARQAPLRCRDRGHLGPPPPGPHRRLGRSEALLPTGCASTAKAAGTGCSRTPRW